MTVEKASRAPVAPPKRAVAAQPFLPEAKVKEEVGAADNMTSKKEVMMSFNMDRDWHSRFKMTAASRGMKMKDLLLECFAVWEREQRRK